MQQFKTWHELLFTRTRDTLHKTGHFEATFTPLDVWKYRNYTKPVFCPFLNHWINFWIVVRVFCAQLGLICVQKCKCDRVFRSKTSMSNASFHSLNSRSDGFDAIFRQINLRYQWAIWVSAILTLDFNRISQQMSLNTAPIFPLQNSAPRLLRVFIRPPPKFR